MRQVEQDIASGNIHDAIHDIEEMLAGTAELGLPETEMHLQLALSAARVDDAPSGIHHLEHYVAVVSDHEREEGEEIMALLEAGKLPDAEHELEQLLGAMVEEEQHQENDDEDDHEQDQ